MTATIIQTEQFRFNKNEETPELRFPDLALRALSFNIQIGNAFYVVRVTYNIWANSPQVSISDSTGIALVLNAPLIEKITGTFPNYLYGLSQFAGYSLVWDLSSQAFVFSKDV